MCGRYTGYIDESDELKTIYTVARSRYADREMREGEIFPTSTVPILTEQDGRLQPIPAAWGFPGFRGGLLINARAETAAGKPAFAAGLRHRRCIVPATGYFEWSAEKRKYLFRDPERTILYLAGIYEEQGDTVRFVILTTAANLSAAEVHFRMPVILQGDVLRRWSTDYAFARQYLQREMPALVRTEA